MTYTQHAKRSPVDRADAATHFNDSAYRYPRRARRWPGCSCRRHSHGGFTGKNAEAAVSDHDRISKLAGRTDPWLISPTPCSMAARPTTMPKIEITTLAALASGGGWRWFLMLRAIWTAGEP
jgi:hypothetical protein